MTDVEQVTAVMCLQSLQFHTRYFFKSQYKKKFIVNHHHQRIIDALERVLSGECTRLLITLAPRYGKTELAVKSLISHGLALNASAKFIHLSYADTLALDNSEAVKDVVQSDEYQALFPHVQIKETSRAKDKWYTTEGGGVLARAAGGQVTGFGAGQVDEEYDADQDFEDFMSGSGIYATGLSKKRQFAGAIIIDDPLKPEDGDSDTEREKVNQRFDSTIRNRANSTKTPIIVIMQRVHPRDLVGYLQREDEAEKWEIVSMPCLYHNEAGELTALWPHKETVETLLAQKKANEVVFERQKQQNPQPRAGLLYPIGELRFADFDAPDLAAQLADPDFTFVPADPANEGGDDFAAGAFKLIGSDIYVDHILYNTKGADFNEAALVDMITEIRPSSVGVEAVFGWKETANRVREAVQDRGYENEFRMLRPRQGKHARIMNRSSFVRNNFIFRSDYQKYPEYAKFMRNLTSYLRIQEPGRKNKHDEAPDLCEMAGSHYERNFPHLWGIKPPDQ